MRGGEGRASPAIGTHQTLQAGRGPFLSLPSHPGVRSNHNNRAIKTAVGGRVLGGFIQCLNWEEAREHLRLAYFGATVHPVFLLAASSSPGHAGGGVEGAQQNELLRGCRSAQASPLSQAWPPELPLALPSSLLAASYYAARVFV